jgi:hypothetical protein
MQMLYNSDNFAVVQIVLTPAPADFAAVGADAGANMGDVRGATSDPAPGRMTEGGLILLRGGYEIVDKAARREIFIEGALADRFEREAKALAESGEASQEAFDEFIAGFAGMAQQALVLH